jgi:arginase family enzyme
MGVPAVVERARAVVGEGPTYVSFDIDALDPPSRRAPARRRSAG